MPVYLRWFLTDDAVFQDTDHSDDCFSWVVYVDSVAEVADGPL